MFKRGDIVELNLKRMGGLREVGILKDADHLISAHDGKVRSTVCYEMTRPPVYEKVGRRFVPSGEYREPLQDEWYLSGPIGEPTHAVLVPLPHYPILLPVPELEPEFQVGDWVKDGNGLHIATVSAVEAGGYMLTWSLNNTQSFYTLQFAKEHLTKLPGRPLTTDDLMQVLGGKKIRVECHARCCNETSGGISFKVNVEADTRTAPNTTAFYHDGQAFLFAYIRDGSIVFAKNVEGNIYVVEA